MNQNLLEAIKAVCPKQCEIEILPTKRRGKVDLMVVKFPKDTITPNYDVDDWAIEDIHLLHHDKIRPLQNPAGAYRTIYCCGNYFVFYSPFGGVFRNFEGSLHYEGYGDMEYQKYVGSCADISKVITYLTTVPNVTF